MILLLTDGALRKKAEERSLPAIKTEIELFKNAHKESHKEWSFKLLALQFGGGKKSKFIEKLTEKTVKT